MNATGGGGACHNFVMGPGAWAKMLRDFPGVATTWLLTRESDDAKENAILVPCVKTTLLPWPWPPSSLPARQFRHPRSAAADGLTLFTSRRAVDSWVASARPTLNEVAALRPATSSALEQEGVTPLITSPSGVVGLAEAVRAWWISSGKPPLHLRYPTSEAGLRSAEQAEALSVLSEMGEVDRRLAYSVTAPQGLKESLERAARGDWSISFASPSAVEHFFASGAVIAGAPLEVICLGASTQRTWNTARPVGWPAAINSRESSHTEEVAP